VRGRPSALLALAPGVPQSGATSGLERSPGARGPRRGRLRTFVVVLWAAACAGSGSGPLPPPPPRPEALAPPAGVVLSTPPAGAAPRSPAAAVSSLAATPSLQIPEIDRLVETALADAKMPGCVIVIGRSSGILFHKAYGQRALVPARASMTENTIFDQASLTKPLVTATLIQKLIERGQLRLDDRASQYLPEFASRNKAEITVRQLLLHTSGLPIVNPLSDYADGPKAGLAHVFDQRLEAAPGQAYNYGDLGYIVLGALIERITGERLDKLAQREIFQPLGMRDTGYLPAVGQRYRIAPTEIAEERPIPLIHGEVHDPRAWLLGGVAGNAGVFSTAEDMARFARMLLGEGQLDGVRVLSRSSFQELTRPELLPGVIRSPGWDIQSPYSKPRGRYFSARAFGHGGYTGVSLWIDPELDLFVSFSSNRVHPNAEGNVVALQANITDAAVEAIQPIPAVCAAAAPAVQNGIDVLRARGYEGLRGRRIALITHRAAIAADGTTTLDVLSSAPEVQLVAILSPEHGLEAKAEGHIGDTRDARTALPVYSLYGNTLRPTKRMLEGVDLLVVDLVDVGTRYYTYMSTLHQALIAGAEQGIPVLVLDRPNPIGGVAVEGPLLDPGFENFVNHHRLPVRHGMTAGELAGLINEERAIGARLEVVNAAGWQRGMLQSDTKLPWSNPSPNLRDLEATLLYPAIGLLESTNVSVGRGTERPFHILGAPFIDSRALLRDLRAARLPGVEFAAVDFMPDADPHRGKQCHGITATVTDPLAFEPVLTGLSLARGIWRQHTREWQTHKLMRLVGNQAVVQALFRGASVAELERLWRSELESFRERRARFLRYPDCARYTPAAR
jgi:uncharacterized protein YbbC (DUF1343 family)